MNLGVVFILVLCPMAITASPDYDRCCFPDQYEGVERLMVVDDVNIYYRIDYKRNLVYQTFDVNGESYNVTDIAADKVYVVTKSGCRTETFRYHGLYQQCFSAEDTHVGIGHSEYSYSDRLHIIKASRNGILPVSDTHVGIGHSEYSYSDRLHTIKVGGMTLKIVMQHRNGMCVPVSAEYELNGHKMASIFLYDFDLNMPTPPDMDTVKAMCS